MNDLDVREIREKSGLTQEELAERMGMYKENMYRLGTYQSGQIRPLNISYSTPKSPFLHIICCIA